MIVAVVVLAVVAVAALGWGATAARAAGAAKARIGELDQQLAEVAAARDEATAERDEVVTARDELQTRIDGLGAELATAQAELATARTERDDAARQVADADRRVAEAEAARAELEQRATIAEAALAERTAERDAVTTERDAAIAERDEHAVALAAAEARFAELGDELAAASERAERAERAERLAESAARSEPGPGVPTADVGEEEHVGDVPPVAVSVPLGDAWPLEARRLERLWRERVAVVLDGPSPVEGAAAVAGALGVVADASREETGVVVDVRWDGAPEVPDALAAPVVRVAEELVALARDSDGGELIVTPGAEGVGLALRTEPLVELDAGLAAAVQALGGVATVAEDGTIRVDLAVPAAR